MRALEICRALSDSAGFDRQVLDDALLRAAIRRRMLACGEAATDRYADRLSTLAAERDELLEELLVRESWFFRDAAVFDLLRAMAAPGADADRHLRVLSAPCAGGEEPYSIAMTLAGAGLRTDQYHIDAMDISRRGLEIARLARYPRRLVRHVPETLKRQYLLPADDGRIVEVAASLRGSVTLHHANLLDLPAPLGPQRYAVVFCRNVLIYLDRPARVKLLGRLQEMLAEDGILVVGHAEPGLLTGSGLTPVGDPAAFAFGRTRAAPTPAKAERRPEHPAATRRPQPAEDNGHPPARTTRAADEGSQALVLDHIRELANRGSYPQASQAAELLIGSNPACAPAYHLLGLIRAAQGRGEEARRSLERAVYLDPGHAPTLRHLAMVLEAAGELEAAKRLLRRAERAGAHP